jgi:L-iditol 2-dehydrogenase
LNPSAECDIVKEIHKLTDNIGVDATIVATGNMNTLMQALKITRKGGRILLFGVPSSKSGFDLNLGQLYSNEHLIIPSYGASELETNQALYFIYDKSINVTNLITHRFNLRETNSAFQCAHTAHDSMKVIIVS